MWLISDLIKKFHRWVENHAFETEMAGKPHLPLWRIALNPFTNFYLLHCKWIWTTAITGIGAYTAILQLTC